MEEGDAEEGTVAGGIRLKGWKMSSGVSAQPSWLSGILCAWAGRLGMVAPGPAVQLKGCDQWGCCGH